MKRIRFPFYRQAKATNCGPTCLLMIAEYYGKTYSIVYLNKLFSLSAEGTSILDLSNVAESIGMRSLAIRISYDKLQEIPLPAIAHWGQSHFIVIYEIKKDKIYVADPARGLLTYTKNEFLKGWLNSKKTEENQGVLLILEPMPEFYRRDAV